MPSPLSCSRRTFVPSGAGEPDPAGDGRRFTNYEMASRMSFLLWNTIPDDGSMRAAAAGELTEDETLRVQPRADDCPPEL